MTLGTVYMVGPPIIVMATLGAKHLFLDDERLAIFLLVSALLPLSVFIIFNILGKDTHVRYLFVTLFPWLILAATGTHIVIKALQDTGLRWMAWIPAVAVLSTYAFSDYTYMTTGEGFRGRWREAFAYVQKHRRPGELVAGDWISRQMGFYYLKDSTIFPLLTGAAFRQGLPLPAAPIWSVYRIYQPSAGYRLEELKPIGVLKAYFNNRVPEPYHAIHVYHYRPEYNPKRQTNRE